MSAEKGWFDVDREAIVRTFLAETEEQLAQMEEALLALEEHPEDAGLLGTVFRGAHTLKGNASVLDLGAPGEMAHALEGLLERVRGGEVRLTSALISLVLEVLDVLREMVPRSLASETESAVLRPEERRLLVALEQAAPRESAGTAGPVRESSEPVNGQKMRTLRVELTKLDRMLDLSGEIAVARSRLSQILEDLGGPATPALEAAREADRLGRALQELVMSSRMVAVGPTFRRYVRMVRDLAATTGHRARLVLSGEDVEVDAAIIEKLGDPLTHMIRNALDHGIEPPAARAAAGKPASGTIRLSAAHAGGSVVIRLEDDGAGLDRERILRTARTRGLVGPGEAPSGEEIDRLIFEPGFSTSETVTALSGRGVGMDVVRCNIEALRGTISIESVSGQGTAVTLRLPLTLAIIDGLAVGVGTETYIVPLEAVSECIELPAGSGPGVASSEVIPVRGRTLPCLRLRSALGLTGRPEGREHVVVVRAGGTSLGLIVESLFGERQVVIKPLETVLGSASGFSGSTILGDGRVCLILDVAALREAGLSGQRACA